MRKQSAIRLLSYSLLMAASIGVAGFFLAMLRPWHQNKLIALTFACVAIVWFATRSSRLVRDWLGVLAIATAMVSIAAGVWWYREMYVPLHPSVFNQTDKLAFNGETSRIGPSDSGRESARQVLQDQFISTSQNYRRPRVLEYENYELGTTAEGASRHEFTFDGQAPIRLSADLSWNENPSKDRTWAFNLHAMGFVERLAEKYRRTHDEKWLSVAEGYVLDWISDNHDVWFWYPSEFSWHDHATALRLRAWVAFWQVWVGSPLATTDKSIRIVDAMLAHATRLADPHFYTESHNHGIYQDIALLEFSLQFPQFDSVPAWRELSMRRLRRQMSDTISKNGVHLEHSPGYHLKVAKLLLEISELCRLNDPAIARQLEIDAAVERMADFLARVLMPNGYLPRLGDTDTESIQSDPTVWSMLADRSERLRGVLAGNLTAGSEVASYPTEGYVIDRTTLGPSQSDAAYLIFTAASHEGRGHKHHDDLSFVWFAHGKELLTDAGKYSYNYTDPIRKWAVSSAAHNTVLVDGLGFEGFRASIDEFFYDSQLTFIRASHRNFPGIEHVRRLLYFRPTLLLVLDDLNAGPDATGSRRQRKFEQLFHLGPEMKEVVANGARKVSHVTNSGPDRVGVLVQSLFPESVVTQAVEGQRHPFQGWLSLRHGSLQPAKVVSFQVDGAGASFVTAVKAFRSDDAARRFSDSVTLEKDESNITVSWRDETGGHSIRMPARPTKPTRVRYERAIQ